MADLTCPIFRRRSYLLFIFKKKKNTIVGKKRVRYEEFFLKLVFVWSIESIARLVCLFLLSTEFPFLFNPSERLYRYKV